jgi:isoleucyl-tRNA synthetase
VAAYQTLYRCLEVISQLMSPVAPFFADRLFTDLNKVTGRHNVESVHISMLPEADAALIDKALEERMELAQKISSMTLALRKKVNIRVRQPLQKIMIPVLDPAMQSMIESVRNLILAEVNVKEIEYITDTAGILVKKIKPNFKVLGKKAGAMMKELADAIVALDQKSIAALEQTGSLTVPVAGLEFGLSLEDVEIASQDIPGWEVNSEGKLTVALDVTITEPLRQEGIARELVNRIQNIRKDKGFDVTDRIVVKIKDNGLVAKSVNNNLNYICSEILASSLTLVDDLDDSGSIMIDVDDSIKVLTSINKL